MRITVHIDVDGTQWPGDAVRAAAIEKMMEAVKNVSKIHGAYQTDFDVVEEECDFDGQ